MKRALFLSAAAAVVLVANGWVLVGTWQNRSEAAGGTVELTERELRLPPLMGESTALMLDLDWAVVPADKKRSRMPGWLTAGKLAALGFDCHVPVASPNARDHYASLPARLVYLVLEFEGEAWKQAGPDQTRRTHLFAIDAGRDPRRLREQHPDLARCIITRGMVRVLFQDRDVEGGALLAQPRLLGSILMLQPNQVFVPKPYSAMLQDLRRREDQPEAASPAEPRFAVTVSWGRNHEPWVQGVRQLP